MRSGWRMNRVRAKQVRRQRIVEREWRIGQRLLAEARTAALKQGVDVAKIAKGVVPGVLV